MTPRRWLLLPLVVTALGACRGAAEDKPAGAPAAVPHRTSAVAEGACFVGPLFRNEPTSHSRPSEYCVGGVLYAGASHRLGRRNLFDVSGAPEPGGYVRVRATEGTDLLAVLERKRACEDGDGPMPQMRSDWAPEEGTYHTTEDQLRQATYLRATSVSSVDLVEIDAPPSPRSGRKYGAPDDPDARVTARIDNPFDFALEGLTLAFHYEGGRGKPLPRYRELPLPTTPPGANRVVKVPAALNEDDAWYHFASLSIEGSAGGCTFVPSTFQR